MTRRATAATSPCLDAACHGGHLAVARALVEAGGEALLLQVDGVYGCSCLHLACGGGHAAIAEYLVSLPPCAGLVGLQDSPGRTPYDLALAMGHAEAARAVRAASAGRPA